MRKILSRGHIREKRKCGVKRVLAFALVFVMCVSLCVPVWAASDYPNTWTNTGNQAQDVAQIALTQVGYKETGENHTKYATWYYGYDNAQPWCAIFVSWCINQAGGVAGVKKAAVASPGSFGLSGVKLANTTPRTGDLVFFENNGKTNGGDYGYDHVGLVYNVDSNYIYTVEGNKNDAVMQRKYDRSTGKQVNYPSTYIVWIGRPNYAGSDNPNPSATPTISISGQTIPTSLTSGSNFGLYGTIRTDYGILTSVSGSIFKENQQSAVQSASETPNSASFNINTSKINNNLIFSTLSAGNYSYVLSAEATYMGKRYNQVLIQQSFSVSSNDSGQVPTISISGETYPTTLALGANFGLYGTISTNCGVLTEVSGTICSEDGCVVDERMCYPNTATLDVRSSVINQQISFEALNAGKYRYILTASADNNGKTNSRVLLFKEFTVGNLNATPPAEPADFNAQYVDSATIFLSWSEVPGATSYDVQYYSQTNHAWKTDRAYPGASATSYTSTGMGAHDSWDLRVRAVRDGAGSDWVEFHYYAHATHTWDSGTVMSPASCTEAGTRMYSCTLCSATKTEPIAATGHTNVTDPAVAATCVEQGKTEGVHCSACGEVLTAQQIIPATGHSYAASWSSDDTYHWHAATCAHTDEISAKAEHSWDDGVITTEATYLNDGVRTITCTVCGREKTEIIPHIVSESITIDSSTFPDSSFRQYVIGTFAEGKDQISKEAIASIEEIDCSGMEIADLTGIEYFTGLKKLVCTDNALTSLNVTQNTALTWLNCNRNELKEIDLSKNTELRYLQAYYNQLASLDLSNNKKLANENIVGAACTYAFTESIKLDAETVQSQKVIDMSAVVGRENIGKIKNVSGGTYNAATGILTADAATDEISYEYSCGGGVYGHTYILKVTVHLAAQTETLPDFEVAHPTSANITAPEGGWVIGDNTFSVSAEKACVLAVSYDGGQTYTRLTATANGDGSYSFNVNITDENTIIACAYKGDVNGNGSITSADYSMTKAAFLGKIKVSPLNNLCADANGNGSITSADYSMIKAAFLGKIKISW